MERDMKNRWIALYVENQVGDFSPENHIICKV